MTWQPSFKTTVDEAVFHTELKMKRLLPEEDIWQRRSELLEDVLPGSKRASAGRYSYQPSLPNPELLWQNLSLHFGKPTLWAQFMKAQKWRRAYGICLVPSRSSQLKPLPVCTALGQGDPGYNTLTGRLFSSIAPSLQTSPCRSGQEHTAESWQPLHLKLAIWHRVIQYTSLVISPILCEGGSWKIAFCLK